jgi:hypothetical protein
VLNGDPSVRWDQRTLLEKAQSLLHEGLHLTIPNASDAALGEIISNNELGDRRCEAKERLGKNK